MPAPKFERSPQSVVGIPIKMADTLQTRDSLRQYHNPLNFPDIIWVNQDGKEYKLIDKMFIPINKRGKKYEMVPGVYRQDAKGYSSQDIRHKTKDGIGGNMYPKKMPGEPDNRWQLPPTQEQADLIKKEELYFEWYRGQSFGMPWLQKHLKV